MRIRQRSSAQAMVEFALALPLFVLLLLAMIDFARLLFTYVSLADASREMARAAAISRSSNSTVVNAFNNYAVIAGSANPQTDAVVVTVADQSCVTDQRQGNPCSPTSTATVSCPMPVQQSCAIPSRTSAGGGYVEVDVTYTFAFNPLFQTGLAGVAEVSFMRPVSLLTTGERAYLE
jgi:Flp pilus assembly protein TadG